MGGMMKKFNRRQAISVGSATVAGLAGTLVNNPAVAETTKNRPLRRKERELTEEQAREVIDNAYYAVLSTADEEGYPYGVPISPVLVGNTIYFHGIKLPGGRKADNILKNENVSLCYVAKAHLLPEWYSIDFASAIVTGKAHLIEDKKEEMVAIKHILARLAPKNSAQRNMVQMKHRLPLAQFWKVDIEKITGKARGARKWVKGESIHAVQDMGPSPWLVGVE